MKKFFFNVYKHLLYSLAITALSTYLLCHLVNSYRLQAYVERVSHTTFGLIAEGLSRHEGEKQQSWLQAVNRITGLEIEVKDYAADDVKLKQLDVELPLFRNSSSAITVRRDIPGTGSYLKTHLLDIDESFARATALLILNDLGRFPAEKRQQRLHELQQRFSYPVNKHLRSELELTAAQIRRINNGDVFVSVQHSESETTMLAIAPYGNTDDLLVLGPVSMFLWYPPELLLLLLLFVLLLIAVFGYYFVTPLEQGLDILVSQVDRIGHGRDRQVFSLEGNDGLGKLASRMNQMSERIHVLLENQREILNAVSHELRTPVSRLDFRLELLKDELENLKQKQRIEGMQDDLHELNGLVEELLVFARLTSTEHPYHPEYVDLSALINTLKDKLLLKSEKRVAVDIGVGNVWADESALNRIIQNLLSNALKYAVSEVTVSAWAVDDICIIQIDDDGPGIEEDDFSMVFEPFARVDASRNKQTGGFGLGLAICRKLVHVNHGDISLQKSEMGGASFTVTLPMSEVME